MAQFKAQLGQADKVVYEWHEGKSFCRKYASGFMEQGGFAKDGVEVTLPQPFSDTNFVVVGLAVVGGFEVKAASERADLRTTASIMMYYTNSAYSGYWLAFGY